MGNYRAMVGAALATIGAAFLAIWNWTVLDGVVPHSSAWSRSAKVRDLVKGARDA